MLAPWAGWQWDAAPPSRSPQHHPAPSQQQGATHHTGQNEHPQVLQDKSPCQEQHQRSSGAPQSRGTPPGPAPPLGAAQELGGWCPTGSCSSAQLSLRAKPLLGQQTRGSRKAAGPRVSPDPAKPSVSTAAPTWGPTAQSATGLGLARAPHAPTNGSRGLHSRAPQATLSLARGQEPWHILRGHLHPLPPCSQQTCPHGAASPWHLARRSQPAAPCARASLAGWSPGRTQKQQARSRRSSWSSQSVQHPAGRGMASHGHCSPQPPRCPSPPRPSRNGDARGSRQRCSRDQARQGPAARGRQQTPQPSLHPSCSSPSARPGGHRFTQTATCLQKDFIKLQKYTNHPHN